MKGIRHVHGVSQDLACIQTWRSSCTVQINDGGDKAAGAHLQQTTSLGQPPLAEQQRQNTCCCSMLTPRLWMTH